MGEIADSPVTEWAQLQAAHDDGRLWIAADDHDRPVGFALVILIEDQPHLDELSVHPDHGRRGLGRQLVDAVQSWTERTGYTRLTLSTFSTVPWNGPFYARMGFVAMNPGNLDPALSDLRLREKARGLPIEDRVIMAWRPAE